MMRYIIVSGVLLFLGYAGIANAQYAVVTSDSTIVRAEYYKNSAVNDILYKGTLVKLTNTSVKGWERIEKGWIRSSDILEIEGTLQNFSSMPDGQSVDHALYVTELLRKKPQDLTELEIQYLMLNERKKDESMRKSVRTIRNVQMFNVILTVTAIVVSAGFAISGN